MAYGEIYNTTWWGVALDTARTAGTEPDFFGSQMKLLTSNQPELVTNGDFATDSNWTKEAGWTISGGTANFSGGTGNRAMYQPVGITNGKTYKIQYTVSFISSGQVAARLGGMSGVDEVTATAIGTYTGYITATGSANGNIHIEDNNNNFVGSIDNVSVKEVRLDLDQIEAKKCLADWIHTTALKDLNN